MSYKIIKRNSHGDLEKSITEYLNKGWIPTGGILFKEGSFLSEWYQAIYKPKV